MSRFLKLMTILAQLCPVLLAADCKSRPDLCSGDDETSFLQVDSAAAPLLQRSSAAAQQRSSAAAQQTRQNVKARFVERPSPVRLADIKKEHVDTNGMVKTSLEVPGTNEEVAIFLYETAADKEVSGAISRAHSWEPGNVIQLLDVWKKHEASLPKIPQMVEGRIVPSKSIKLGNFLDVGGNLGSFVLPIAHQISRLGGQTVTIEGMPSIAAHLKASIEANQMDNVALYPYAVGASDKKDSLKMALNPVNKGGSAVVGNKGWTNTGIENKFHQAPTVVEVSLTTIDAILHSDPALQKLLAMKIDIEGNEGRALKGATNLLAKYPPCYLMTELNPEWLEKAGTPCASVKEQLENAGYDTSPVYCRDMVTVFLQQRDMQSCLDRVKSI